MNKNLGCSSQKVVASMNCHNILVFLIHIRFHNSSIMHGSKANCRLPAYHASQLELELNYSCEFPFKIVI